MIVYPFGYRGFTIWADANGWQCRRILTKQTYDLEGVSDAATAMKTVDALVAEYVEEAERNEKIDKEIADGQ